MLNSEKNQTPAVLGCEAMWHVGNNLHVDGCEKS